MSTELKSPRRVPRTPVRVFVSVLAGLLVASPDAAAQRYCRGEDDRAEVIRSVLERYVTADSGTGSDEARKQFKLPSGMPRNIVLLLNETTCALANRMYRAHFRSAEGRGFSNRVYVFQVGGTYVVADPAYVHRKQPGLMLTVFDSRWEFVAYLI